MLPTHPTYGATGPFTDSPPSSPWHELNQLAQRAGVSVETLCTAIEIATLYTSDGKTAPPSSNLPFHPDDLEDVVRLLTDDDFTLETKTQWQESDHPRDEGGRFTGGGGAHSETRHGGIVFLDISQIGYRVPPPPPAQIQNQVRNEIRGIHDELQKRFPSYKSRWSRHLGFQAGYFLKALGVKKWVCNIVMAQELTDHMEKPNHPDHKLYEIVRFSTLLHESFHAISPTQREQYLQAPGWEEAVIENAVRTHQQEIAQKLGLHFTPHQFKIRNEAVGYADEVAALEKIRHLLQIDESHKRIFYDHLVTLPAHEKEEDILLRWKTLPTEHQQKFENAFAHYRNILNSYKPRTFGPSPIKAETTTMSRSEVNTLILSARTPEEVTKARQVRDEWMKNHPEDWGMLTSSEVLEMLADALDIDDPDSHTIHYINCDA